MRKALFLLLLCIPLTVGAGTKGLKIVVQDQSGNSIPLYGDSHALLIGVSEYQATDWTDLESIPSELATVEKALIEQDFNVEKHLNPNGKELKAIFQSFIDNYGYDPENRLLFFFSGHGWTKENGKKGYLVPADAPNPEKDQTNFLRKALPMSQVLAWARQTEAKHSLYLFDSCFSGTIFQTKSLPDKPPHITEATSLPVRQFITAGKANELVPSQSTFTPTFVDALKYGFGDLNKDGYVSGTELGLYLQEIVPQHVRQTPQFGKIQQYDLSRGDFIFVLPEASKVAISSPSATTSVDTSAIEIAFWNSIKDSKNLEMFEAYLKKYPAGEFSLLAKIELKAISDKAASSTPSSYSSTASSSDTRAYCYDTYYKSFYRSSTWRCTTPNFKISKQEFKNKRLKGESSGSASTASSSGSSEVLFWKSVRDSDDPDMFREYLRQFPQGAYAALAKLRIKKLSSDTATVAKSSIPDLNYGDYYALVIGNNKYDHLRDLKTAVNDARSVTTVLRENYGFKVTLLEDANRSRIIQSLSSLREKVGSNDNALIYYAGHGYLDVDADEGYWLPVDASDNPENWIMTDQVISQIRAMRAKHVMVVADSCFSGTIRRSLKIVQRSPGWIERIVNKKSRTALTAGGLEPVSDTGDGRHSVFAGVFISLLKQNVDIIDGTQLFSQLRPLVMMNANQTPEYGDIHRAGHAGGEFLFVRQ